VVTLDPLLQVFGDIVQWGARQEARFPGISDGRRIGTSGIGADPVGREQGLILQHLAEEPLGRV
jgi:hypothetical protein